MSEKSTEKPISVTLDPELLQELQVLVAEGKITSVSAWLNETARSRIERDRQAIRVRAYVEENLLGGDQLTEEELAEAEGMLAASIARTEARRSTVAGPPRERWHHLRPPCPALCRLGQPGSVRPHRASSCPRSLHDRRPTG